MPEYVFTIKSVGQVRGERIAVLEHDAAALDYACELAFELRKGGEYDDPNLMITVRDNNRRVVCSIPCLPGRA
jgi:hypothetical protein